MRRLLIAPAAVPNNSLFMLAKIMPYPRKSYLCANACVLILVACALAQATRAQQPPAPKDAKETGTIAGRITLDNHGVAGVLVTLAPSDWSEREKSVAKATTDAEGRYRLTNVPPGRYYLNPFAPAFVVSDVNPAAWQPGRLLNVAPGDKLEGLDFTLTRGGVITGRVRDAEGKPIVETSVRVMAANEADRKNPQFSVPVFQYQTDDRGVYRLFGLTAGRYLVFVGEAPEDGMVRVGGPGSIPRTFYGNTTEIAQARPVEVTGGDEATAIDIVVGKQPRSYEVAGRVVDERGRAVAGASVMYGPVSAEGRFMGSFGSDGARTDERGEFHTRGLSPGHYGIFAAQAQPFAQEQSATYSDAAVFDIIDADVSGVEIKLARGATLSGVVQLEGTTNPAVIAKLTELSLGASVRQTAPANTVVAPSFAQTKVNADGSFQLTGLRPGRNTLYQGWPQVKGFTLARVQRDGVDQPEGIEVATGERITGVRVVIAYGASTIRGQVQFSAPRPAGGHLHAEVRRNGAPVGTGGGFGEVDSLGRFVVENLAAGEYEVTLFEDYPAFGSEQRRPPVDRKVVNVPENGEAQVTLVFKQEGTPPPPQ